MNFKIQHLVLIIFISNISLAQTIKGKILSSTNSVVPYATIQIGDSYGVISNEEGDFSITTKGFSKEETVTISCLGFETLEQKLSDFSSKSYILKERVNELSEVFLSSKTLTVEEILNKVKEHAKTNYTDSLSSQIFYRTSLFNTPKKLEFEVLKASELSRKAIKSINSEFNTLRQLAENKTSSNYKDVLVNYSKLNGNNKINVVKATKLINEDKDKSAKKLSNDFINLISKQLDSGSTYKVKTGFFKIEDSLKVGEDLSFKHKDSLNNTNNLIQDILRVSNNHAITETSYFSFLFDYNKNEYTLEDVINFNDEAVYKINFNPKRKSQKFQGTFYVNTSDFAVIKVEYKLGENRFGERLNLKALVGIKYIENGIEGSVLYKKDASGFYTLQHISTENKQYVYFSRSFKFIKNRINKDDDKTVFKFDFKIEDVITTKNELYFIENTLNSPEAFKAFKNQDTYTIKSIKAYNPETWKDYNILSPIEAIKNYHLEN